ncbi:MAG: Ig-like domain-containing protein [Acidobacteriaceae bacterium]
MSDPVGDIAWRIQPFPLVFPTHICTHTDSLYSSATVTFSNLVAGWYVPTFTYSGDANWLAGGLYYVTQIEVAPISPMAASTTTLSISPTSISGTQAAQFTTTVAGATGPTIAPTGLVYFFNNGNFLTYDVLTPGSTGATSSATFSISAASFWNSGANQLTTIYLGDANYGSSTSNVVNVTANQTQVGNFTLAPQLSQVTVQGGSSGSVGINLAPIYGFSGAVALSCAPSSSQFSCSVNPTTVTVSGQATAMLTINAAVQTARNAPPNRQKPSNGPEAAGMLALGFLFVGESASQTSAQRAAQPLPVCSDAHCQLRRWRRHGRNNAHATAAGIHSGRRLYRTGDRYGERNCPQCEDHRDCSVTLRICKEPLLSVLCVPAELLPD